VAIQVRISCPHCGRAILIEDTPLNHPQAQLLKFVPTQALRGRDPCPWGRGRACIPRRWEDGAAGIAVHNPGSEEPLRDPAWACRSLRPRGRAE